MISAFVDSIDSHTHHPVDVAGESIKGSIEPTHGSVCSGVRKLHSLNVLKWLSTKVE